MTPKNDQPTEEKVATKRKPNTRLVVVSTFAHDGVYYTTDNIKDAPADVVDARIAKGHIIEQPLSLEELVPEK